jgi:hypothetical protein
MQCACAILSPVACPGLQYFSTLSHKRHDFRFFFYLFIYFFVWSISHSKKNWAKRASVFMSGTLLFLADINKTWIFSTDFRKYPNIRLHKNPPSGSRVVPHGRTEITKLIVAFRNSANAPTKMRYFKHGVDAPYLRNIILRKQPDIYTETFYVVSKTKASSRRTFCALSSNPRCYSTLPAQLRTILLQHNGQ